MSNENLFILMVTFWVWVVTLNGVVRAAVDHVVWALVREHDASEKQIWEALEPGDAGSQNTDNEVRHKRYARNPKGDQHQHQQPEQSIQRVTHLLFGKFKYNLLTMIRYKLNLQQQDNLIERYDLVVSGSKQQFTRGTKDQSVSMSVSE